MTFIQPGTPRLAVLNTDGSYAASYFLPPPNAEGGMSLEWEERNQTKVLVDGSDATRRKGFIPVLTLTWAIYDDVNAKNGHVIGGANGNQLDINSLLAVLDNPVGTLKVSPGPSAGGFVIQTTKIGPITIVKGLGIAKDVSITLKGGTICSAKILGSF
jgi:hypothetical protein